MEGQQAPAQDYWAYTRASGAPFWDFYRTNLHKCLLDRAVELGTTIVVNARATDYSVLEMTGGSGAEICTVDTADGRKFAADLVVGADGINSKLREVLLGRQDPPVPTGDLAYRLLLNTDEMRGDPDLRPFVEKPQVNYWLGPDKHAVNYVLRGLARQTGSYLVEPGLLFNMVLLVPDDLPAGANTFEGKIDEMHPLGLLGCDRRRCLIKHCKQAVSV